MKKLIKNTVIDQIGEYGAERILRFYGVKVTEVRKEILEIFYKNKKPIKIDLILSLTDIDKPTVYRTIEIFLEKKIIKRLDFRMSTPFYEINHSHHHHIICVTCKKVEEIDVCWVPDIIGFSKDFKVIFEHSLEFFGKCKKCV